MKRTGPKLSLLERTMAMIQLGDGADRAELAAEYRVRVAYIAKLEEEWRTRTGVWYDCEHDEAERNERLLDAEFAQLAESAKSDRKLRNALLHCAPIEAA